MPTRIPGCVLWLRADLGITLATGVSAWQDQATPSRSYTQATGSKQPTQASVNGRPSLRFTAANTQSLAAPLIAQASPFELFIVCQATSPISVARGLYDTASGMETGAFFNASTSLSVGFSATISDCTAALHIYRIVYNGASSQIYQDGALKASGTSSSGGLPSVIGALQGPSSAFDGWISEFVATDALLSASDAESLTRYMGSLYGIAVS